MTVNALQERLILEIERITKDMSLLDSKGRQAVLKGYPQAIPVFSVFREWKEDAEENDGQEELQGEDELFPYFVVRADGIEYQAEDKDGSGNRVRIFIVFAVTDADTNMKGYYTLTAVLERVIQRFQKNQAMGEFWCSRKMNAVYQEDDTFPQFFAGLEMLWYLPAIEQEEMW